jgi:hypothetical protein
MLEMRPARWRMLVMACDDFEYGMEVDASEARDEVRSWVHSRCGRLGRDIMSVTVLFASITVLVACAV